ncbi:hypothetical protein CR513_18399, partial [Mucuna pruriens]
VGTTFQQRRIGLKSPDPKVTTFRASKNLNKLPMEELFGTLKVHEIELNEDEGHKKGKSIALKAQKTYKG